MLEKKEALPLFKDLGISPKILNVLEKSKFINPTPIQNKTIPIALKGNDLVGIAQTGTGKTLAFGIPMLQKLINENKAQGLVLLPTRELALQVEDMLQKIGRELGLKTAVLIGGDNMDKQIRAIRNNPHILIATPGRINDHLQQKLLSLKNISVVVLDEADRMFDIGFADVIKSILSETPKERQTLLFSATMPKQIVDMANKYMKTPLRIEIAPAGTTAEFVDQEIFIVNKEAKTQLLEKVLQENSGKTLVFVRTRHGAKSLSREVKQMGHTVCELHSDKSLAQRKDALSGFKGNRYRVLIATDIAARGIDVNDIYLVINYDLPEDLTDYVHRIGRTGRAGKSGKAITFATRSQTFNLKRIERLIQKEIKISETPKLPERRKSTNYIENVTDYEPRRKNYNQRKRYEHKENNIEEKDFYKKSSKYNGPKRKYNDKNNRFKSEIKRTKFRKGDVRKREDNI